MSDIILCFLMTSPTQILIHLSDKITSLNPISVPFSK